MKTFGELLRDTWSVYTSQFNFLLMTALIFILPLMVVMDFIPKELPTTDIGSATLALFESGIGDYMQAQEWMAVYLYGVQSAYFWHAAAVQLVLALTAFIATAGVIVATARAQAGKEVQMSAVYTAVKPRLVPAIGTGIIVYVLTSLLFLLLFIPGFIFTYYWIFAVTVVLLSDKEYGHAMQASKALVRGRWWDVFLRLFFVAILVTIATVVFYAALGSAGAVIGVSAVAQTIAYLMSFFITIFTTLLYLHLRDNADDVVDVVA